MARTGVNLIPSARREARRRKARMRFWLTATVVCAAFWLVGFLGAQLTLVSDDRALRIEFDEIYAEAEGARKAVADLRAEASRGRSRLQASRAVGEQPDWSLLLALLSRTLGDQAVLRSVGLQYAPEALEETAPSAPEAPNEPPPVTLELSGLGQTQYVVSRFVLRLEQTPIFESVRLVDTLREPILAGHAVAFRIECVLGAGEP